MKIKLVLSIMVVLFALAKAQSETILTGQGVTESALIRELTPEPASGTDAVPEPVTRRTRSFRVSRDPESRGVSDKRASASLLITFETNSAVLTAQAKQSLDVLASALSSDNLASFRFAVYGHADPRGDSGANLLLSRLRAESVRQYLVHSKYIDGQRLEAIGKGDKELLNLTDVTAPENRRVTFVNLGR